jgi:hypothetical protein
VLTHMLCHIYLGTDPEEITTPPDAHARVFWIAEKELLASNCMPGVADVLRIAKSKQKGIQFEELSFTQD